MVNKKLFLQLSFVLCVIVSIIVLQDSFCYSNEQGTEEFPAVETASVKQFGAIGDNVNDDTAAFQKALHSARTVIVPEGTYQLNSQVNFIRSGQRIIGANGATIACNSNEAVFYAENLSAITVNGLSFIGTGGEMPQSTKAILDLRACNNVIIDNCRFMNIPFYYCIRFLGCNTVKAANNEIDTYLFSGIACGNGTSEATVNSNRIVNGYGVIQGHRYPITLSSFNGEQEIYPESYNLEAGFNYIEDNIPQWEGIDSHGGNNIWIHDNVVKGTMTGIALVDNRKTLEKRFRNAIVENNRIELTTGIAARSRTAQNSGLNIKSNHGATNIQIIGNIIENANYNLGPTDAGIRIGGINSGIVSKNTVKAKVTGIRLVRECDNVTINENKIFVDGTGSAKSAGIRNTAKSLTNIEIRNNYIGSSNEFTLKFGIYNENKLSNFTAEMKAILNNNNNYGNVNIP